jgi:hypothetical protein
LPGSWPGQLADPAAGDDDVDVLVVGDEVEGFVVVGLVVAGAAVAGFVVVGAVVVGADVAGRRVVGLAVVGLAVVQCDVQCDVQGSDRWDGPGAILVATWGSEATRLWDWSDPKLACAL